MRKKEIEKVSIEVSKKLLEVLEAESYFGWSKQDFFVVAVQRGIGCEMSAMEFEDMKKVETKHGFDPGAVEYSEKRKLVSP